MRSKHGAVPPRRGSCPELVGASFFFGPWCEKSEPIGAPTNLGRAVRWRRPAALGLLDDNKWQRGHPLRNIGTERPFGSGAGVGAVGVQLDRVPRPSGEVLLLLLLRAGMCGGRRGNDTQDSQYSQPALFVRVSEMQR